MTIQRDVSEKGRTNERYVYFDKRVLRGNQLNGFPVISVHINFV